MSFLFGLVLTSVGPVLSAHAQIRSAAICTEAFENDPSTNKPWLDQIWGAMDGCKNFVNTMNSMGASDFFFSTNQGEHHALETQSGVWEDMVENEDILYWVGHSGAWSTHGANLAGFKFQDRVFGENLRLGNEGRRLSVLAMHGCMVLEPNTITKGSNIIVQTSSGPVDTGVVAIDDAVQNVAPRWAATLAAGVRVLLGSWNTFIIGDSSHKGTVSGVGSDFATYMSNGMGISEAWWRAAYDGNSGNNPAAYATGANSADCHNRLLNMNLQNMNTSTFTPRWQTGWVRCEGLW
jgi:hypothetical protein